MLNAPDIMKKHLQSIRLIFTILGNKEIKNMSALDKNTSGLLVLDLMIIQNQKWVNRSKNGNYF